MKHPADVRAVLRLFLTASPSSLWLGAALAALTVLMGMALLGLSGWFITATALAGLGSAAVILFDVFVPSAGIRLLALGRTVSRYGERLVTHDATLAVLAALRERLFRGWAQPDAARALRLRPARLLFRLTADIDALDTLYLRLLVPAGAALGAAILAGAVLGSMQLWMGFALLAWLLLAGWGITLVTARRARPLAVRRALAMESLRSRAVDLVAGQTELAMAGQLHAQQTALAAADQRLVRTDLALNRLEARAGWAYGAAGAMTLSGVLLAVGALVEARSIQAPAAALALLVALAAMEPFAALRRGALDAGRTWLAARRLAPRLADSVPADAFPQPALDRGVVLHIQNVSATHGDNSAPALRSITLQVHAGEHVALIGASGAGKSTLLALVAGEISPQSGSVQALPGAWLTQRTELFQDSLRDNLLLAAPHVDDKHLWAALRSAGLAHDVEALSQGLSTPLGEGGLGLSGGQSRRLALARLLLRDVDFWLLDEPTEGLDTQTAHDVLRRLALHAAGHTVLVATHLRREAQLAERLVCIDAGRITADLRRGTPAFDAALAALRSD